MFCLSHYKATQMIAQATSLSVLAAMKALLSYEQAPCLCSACGLLQLDMAKHLFGSLRSPAVASADLHRDFGPSEAG